MLIGFLFALQDSQSTVGIKGSLRPERLNNAGSDFPTTIRLGSCCVGCISPYRGSEDGGGATASLLEMLIAHRQTDGLRQVHLQQTFE